MIRYVALRKESVDRNINAVQIVIIKMVALRKESVERNVPRKNLVNSICRVALRKESVDRNTMRRDFKRLGLLSLSARRAWIEISSVISENRYRQSRSPQGERG